MTIYKDTFVLMIYVHSPDDIILTDHTKIKGIRVHLVRCTQPDVRGLQDHEPSTEVGHPDHRKNRDPVEARQLLTRFTREGFAGTENENSHSSLHGVSTQK